MEKTKLEKILDAETIALYLDEIYGDSARKTVEACKELRKVIFEAQTLIDMIEDSKSEVAQKDEQIDELKATVEKLMAEMVAMKAQIDAMPKAGNDTPIGLS